MTGGVPPRPSARREHGPLRLVAIACAGVSGLSLVAHVLGVLPMPYFLEVFGIPSLLVLFALAAWGRIVDAGTFINGLWVGLWVGGIATVAYDGIRFLVERGHLFGYNGLVPILMYGSWITGRPTSSVAAKVAGWAYHYWNGITFAIIYTLGVGKRHWLFGIAYAMVLECCLLGLFPLFVPVTRKFDFVALSMIGHIAYGAVLGVLAQKYLRG